MGSTTIRELVKKIFIDEKSKAEFISNPERFLNKFSLSEQEKKAVLTTHAKLGLVSSNSSQLGAAIDPLAFWI